MAWAKAGGDGEISRTLRQMRGGLGAIVALSACVNMLTINGSLYLMLVYDRILPSESMPTLFAIFAMVMIAYAFYGFFDVLRTRMLAEVASSLERTLAPRLQEIEARYARERPDLREQGNPMCDLEQLRSYIASAGPPALIDLPWTIFFLIFLSLVHYWLGIVTLVGMIGLGWLALTAERISKRHVEAVSRAGARRRPRGARQWGRAGGRGTVGVGGRE